MSKTRKWITALAVGILVVAAGRGFAAAQQDPQQGPPAIDLQQLQKSLKLDTETTQAVAPSIQRINGLIAQRWERRSQTAREAQSLQAAWNDLLEALTPEQRQQLPGALHDPQVGGTGHMRAGRMGSGTMGGGRMGSGGMGSGMMGGGGMGGGMMGGGGMGFGGMGGGMMGGGHMGSGLLSGLLGGLFGGHMGTGHMGNGTTGYGMMGTRGDADAQNAAGYGCVWPPVVQEPDSGSK